MIRPEHLAYFKSLLEGRADISWNAWFRQHEKTLSEELPRMDFLRLKFRKLDEAAALLNSAGVEYQESPLAKRERYYSLLHQSVLDEKGRPTEQFRRKAYGGAIGAFLEGKIATAKEKLSAQLKRIHRYPSAKRTEELSDMAFDAEMEFRLGNQDLGRMMLELIADCPTGDDLADHAIIRAQELLGASSASK